jgi:hypothetical protein
MPDAPDPKALVHRRRADGTMEVGPDWETLIERQIREAMEEGKFRDLPHQGRPLPNDDNPYAGEWGLAYHVLKNAGVAPPWIEADKEVRGLLDRHRAIMARAAADPPPTASARRRDRAALEDVVIRLNGAIARLNAEAPTYRQQRAPLSVAAELARYEEACRR